MSQDTTNATPATEAEEEAPKTLEDVLALIQPEPVRNMIYVKLDEARQLILTNNRNVAKLKEAQAVDPTNVDYLDKVWHRVVAEESDPDIVAEEKRYQRAIEASEKALKKMRDLAKEKHVQPPMSEEEKQNLRKVVNESKAVITTAKVAAGAIADMADQLLASTKNEVSGGVLSLLPNVESMLNVRGRKAASDDGEKVSYASRIIHAEVDGKAINKVVKKHGEAKWRATWPIVAEELTKRFGSGNDVGQGEIEEAYFASKGVEFRDTAAMPTDYTFTFEKIIKVQNPNDDTMKDEPHKVNVRIIKWTSEQNEMPIPDDVKAEIDKA